MDPRIEQARLINRRSFMQVGTGGIGLAALMSMLGEDALRAGADASATGGLAGIPHFAPKAKRVIYLYMLGAPSGHELMDYKPKLKGLAGTDLPDSVRGGQRLTGFTANQASLPIVPGKYEFKQYGQSGQWLSELMPNWGKIVDDIAFIRTMSNEQINHDPAIMFLMTGFQLAGRPTLGAWVHYALGSENKNLPGFVAFVSSTANAAGLTAHDRMWGPGWLPPRYGGVKFGATKDPVLYLTNPEGFEMADRRRFLDDLAALNEATKNEFGDPEIANRIEQYELAARMQTSVPELTDLSKEPDSIFDLYGDDAKKPGTFARNCLLARRLAERGVRFIQLTHRGWDHHSDLPKQIALCAKDVDQGSAALIQDLKQKGMLDDTLVMWGAEFGRTVYGQVSRPGEAASDMKANYGRDHHVRCYTIWMAGGGIKPGISYGETDDFNYNTIKDPVSVHDRHATVLHLLGIDHTKLTRKYQGRDFRLTDVYGNVVKGLLA